MGGLLPLCLLDESGAVSGSTAPPLKSLTTERRAQEEGRPDGSPRLPSNARGWRRSGGPSLCATQAARRGQLQGQPPLCPGRLWPFGPPPPPGAVPSPTWPGAGADGLLKALPRLQGCVSQAFPTPRRRGLPEGKQPRRRQISPGLLTEAACVRVEGLGADFASRRSGLGSGTAPAQAALRAPPGRKRSPWAARPLRCAWEKGTAAAPRSCRAAGPPHSGLSR